MLELLCPDQYLETVYELDPTALWERGIRGLIIDLDNTLIKWGEYENNTRLHLWFGQLQARGFRLCIVSNNGGKRVLDLAKALEADIVPNAAKPRRLGFRLAMAHMGTEPSTTAMIGDQIFTDVWGGNRLGLHTILVVPISQNEFIGTRLVRKIERRILAGLQARGMLALEAKKGGGQPDSHPDRR